MSSITTGEGGDSVPAVLPGYRFYPTEEVLVSYYLRKKIEGKDSNFSRIIPEIDVCKHEPSDIPAFFPEPDSPDHEMEWFFFSQPDYKYIRSTRFNRATDQGFYKPTGKERGIKARGSKAVIGNKRTLTFYQGRVPKAKKTDWVIHEYNLTKTQLAQLGLDPNQQRDFVLCRLKNKSANYKKLKDDSICDELAEPGTDGFVASNTEDVQAAAAANDMILDPEEHLGHKDLVSVNDNHDEGTKSPNASCLIDNNDTSTCDDDETDGWIFSDFDQQELRAVLGVNLDSPSPPPQPHQLPQPHQPHQLPQPPQPHQPSLPPQLPQPPLSHQQPQPPQPHQQPQPPQPHQQPQPHHPEDYFFSKLQSLSYMELVNVPGVYNDDCSNRQSPIGDAHSFLTHKNNISTNDHNEPLSNTDYSVPNRATDEIISEAYFQPEEYLGFFFDPPQLQDYTLMSPMITELGDVVHAQ